MKAIPLYVLALLSLAVLGMADRPSKETQQTEAENSREIKWFTYEEGWQKSRTDNKHMFVNFTATWCGWCKVLDRTTFADSSVITRLNNDFVPIMVWEQSKDTANLDGYMIAEKDLIRNEFHVRGFPSLWFVSPEGIRIGPAGGYVDAERFLTFLDIVKHYKYDSTRTETGKKIKQEGQ